MENCSLPIFPLLLPRRDQDQDQDRLHHLSRNDSLRNHYDRLV